MVNAHHNNDDLWHHVDVKELFGSKTFPLPLDQPRHLTLPAVHCNHTKLAQNW